MTKLIRSNLFPLKQPLHVLVTGAASGIGRAQALAFLQDGHQVLAVDKEDSVEELRAYGGLTYKADVSEQDQVDRLFKFLDEEWGQLNVVCNTAGQLDGYHKLSETSYRDWQSIMKNNLDSVFLITKAALPYLLDQDRSRLINMTSIAGLTAGGGGVAYTAAKHAIIGFTRQMAYDYSSQGLRANAIAPGAIDTPMNADDFQGQAKPAKAVTAETPVHRWAQPEEVASLTLYLASDAADYIQGAVIPIDGGWMIR